MNNKNVKFFQKHIEKIVLGVCVLAAGYVAWMFVPASNYNVEVQGLGGQALAPSDVPEKLAAKADRLKQRASSKKPSLEDKIFEVPDERARLEERIARDFGRDQFAVFSVPGLDRELLNLEGPSEVPYFIPPLPAPEAAVAKANYAVLAPTEELVAYYKPQIDQAVGRLSRDDPKLVEKRVNEIVEKLESFTAGDPRDFRYTTVAAELDMDKIVAAIEEANVPADHRALPTGWTHGLELAADVILERQTLDELTGQWGPTERVALMPGQELINFRGVKFEFDDPQIRQIQVKQALESVWRNQSELATPDFVPVGEQSRPWSSPKDETNQELTREERRELIKLRREIDILEKQIEAEEHKRRQDEQKERAANRRRGAAQNRPRPGSRRDENFGGDYYESESRSPRRPPTPRQVKPEVDKLTELKEKLTEKTRRYDELAGSDLSSRVGQSIGYGGGYDEFGGYYDPYAEFYGGYGGYGEFGGFDPYGGGGYYQPPVRQGRQRINRRRVTKKRDADGNEIIDNKLQVHAHDLTVEPGKTYRYRVIVGVINPLFQRRNLPPTQQDMYGQLIIETQASDWTEEVKVMPDPQWFFVDAKPTAQTATIEVWRIYDGRPRKTEFKLKPGDPIGGAMALGIPGAEQEVEVFVNGAIVDVKPAENAAIGQTMLRYVDLVDGQMRQRNSQADKNSDARVDLESEYQILGGDEAFEDPTDTVETKLPGSTR